MTVFIGSRYAVATFTTITLPNGSPSPMLLRDNQDVTDRFGNYLVIDGDRLDRIAYTIYGRSDFWYAIADANPEVFLWDPLVAGAILRIPDARDIS